MTGLEPLPSPYRPAARPLQAPARPYLTFPGSLLFRAPPQPSRRGFSGRLRLVCGRCLTGKGRLVGRDYVDTLIEKLPVHGQPFPTSLLV